VAWDSKERPVSADASPLRHDATDAPPWLLGDPAASPRLPCAAAATKYAAEVTWPHHKCPNRRMKGVPKSQKKNDKS
jgi:hypothetical protein